MSNAAQFARVLEASSADLLRTIPMLAPIAARAAEPDGRLLAIIAKAGPLTADEQAYLDAREAGL